MKTIIKHGTKENLYGHCVKCGCEFTCNYEDSISALNNKMTRCPDCDSLVNIYPIDNTEDKNLLLSVTDAVVDILKGAEL